jgi:pSer/pThr/pTyr-binding forkhead associated (FHA) protein
LSREKKKVVFPCDKNEIELGRDPQCDVPLDFPMISWRHARLARAPEGILVEDLGSRNGSLAICKPIDSRRLHC